MRLYRPSRFTLQSLVLLLCIALGGWLYWYFTFPTRLTVAVGPTDGPEASQIAAYARALEQSGKDLRLKVVRFPDVRASAEALQRSEVDLALVRPDILHPSNGRTIAIMREETLFVLAPVPPRSKTESGNARASDAKGTAQQAGSDDKPAQKNPAAIDEAGDLFGKRVGVVVRDEADSSVLNAILENLGFPAQSVKLVPIRLDEIRTEAVKGIDALAFLATPRTAYANRVFEAAGHLFGNTALDLVTFAELEAVSEHVPVLKQSTIPQGALRLNPALPSEEVKAPSVSYRLMAADQADRSIIARVTQYLFEMRPFIAQTDPSIHLMKAPDSETIMTAALPNHRGAIDYFNREQQTFLDRYSDLMWMLLFAAGGLSSLAAWLVQLFARRRREVVDHVLDRLLCILTEARGAHSPAELDELSVEIDGLVTHAVRHARHRATNARTMGALTVALNAARSAISDRRREIAETAPIKAARRVS
jgi:hypothetical protein